MEPNKVCGFLLGRGTWMVTIENLKACPSRLSSVLTDGHFWVPGCRAPGWIAASELHAPGILLKPA
jgi:hypothetical protein